MMTDVEIVDSMALHGVAQRLTIKDARASAQRKMDRLQKEVLYRCSKRSACAVMIN